ncbi:MAG: hypothetical protein A3F43_02670 [Gammaproteobacteria bacterium RIFCSPHIGHO2_12_FULL_42_10]|nr:MAG: hypothetical protein A3F43_02670 [Gammaproteobacteria bacterium RIFCSPHIGHO2_12_FULL_42_10]
MLAAIYKNLLPGETILFSTKKSAIIFVYPTLITVLAVIAYRYMQHHTLLSQLAWIPGCVLLLIWCYVGLEYLTSNYAVTNKRIMMYEGFFNRHRAELRLNTISQVNVDQSLVGQLLNYGVISFHAFGALDAFAYIDHPREFQRFVNQQVNI